MARPNRIWTKALNRHQNAQNPRARQPNGRAVIQQCRWRGEHLQRAFHVDSLLKIDSNADGHIGQSHHTAYVLLNTVNPPTRTARLPALPQASATQTHTMPFSVYTYTICGSHMALLSADLLRISGTRTQSASQPLTHAHTFGANEKEKCSSCQSFQCYDCQRL